MIKALLSFLPLWLIVTALPAQSITNIRGRQEEKKIIVTYDLSAKDAGQTFTVLLLVSEDGGYSWKGPLTAVSGDAGTGVKAGYAKQLVWDVLAEPGRERLQGDRIAFKIRAEYTSGRSAGAAATGTPCQGIASFTDPRDGQTYPTVQIGNQCWMQRNMNFQTGNSWCYNNESSNCSTYGRLYDWETALNVCPKGWHLPSDAEWSTLTTSLGGASVAGGKMKETGTAHWSSPNTGATNSSGFTALPGGYRLGSGNFYYLTGTAYFWSSTEHSSTDAWYRNLACNHGNAFRDGNYKAYGFSCRCLRD
jgi:uncharacterized protein (TIGR02145 family)